MLIWNIQSPHEDNRPVTPVKCTKSAHRGTQRSTTVVVLISGAFVRSRLIYERCLHLSDTFAYRSAHNNLFLTLRVIHKLKIVSRATVPNHFHSSRFSTILSKNVSLNHSSKRCLPSPHEFPRCIFCWIAFLCFHNNWFSLQVLFKTKL